MKIQQLEYVIAVAREGSITKAAKNCIRLSLISVLHLKNSKLHLAYRSSTVLPTA